MSNNLAAMRPELVRRAIGEEQRYDKVRAGNID